MKLTKLFENVELQTFSKYITNKYDVRTFFLTSHGGDIELNSLIIAKENQKEGIGSDVMKELVRYADSKGKRVILSVGVRDGIHGTTSRSRLVKFYKRFGFKENKGSKKDFSVSAGMIRDPK